MAAINVEYYLDGTPFSSYGVFVSGATGFLSVPETKESLSADWDGYHGVVRDLSSQKYKVRKIELSCFIEASGYSDFVSKANAFLAQIGDNTSHSIKQTVSVSGSTYSRTLGNVYNPSSLNISKTWDHIKMVGTFSVKLEQIVPSYSSRNSTYPAPTNPSDGDIHYSLDGVDFKSLQVEVVSSSGLFCKPQDKEPLTVDWFNEHGQQCNISAKRYGEREITLECYIWATSYASFNTLVNAFIKLISASGTHRLRVYYGGNPLVYEVYHPSQMDINTEWNGDRMVGTFTLKLVEPEPVKRVIKASGTARITIASDNIAHIYWGDGSHTFDVSGGGTSQTVSHTYSTSGNFEIIITCETSGITTFSHNGTLIWSRLV